MKYAILAALLFVPLAVAGSYLSRDPTSAEAPKIQLRTVERTVERAPAKPLARKPRPKSKPKARMLEKRRSPVQRTYASRPATPSSSGGADDEDDRATRPSRGAAPVPIPSPARAGVAIDDASADPGGRPDEDAANGGGGGGRGDDGDD
jgi:hypothetical protein